MWTHGLLKHRMLYEIIHNAVITANKMFSIEPRAVGSPGMDSPIHRPSVLFSNNYFCSASQILPGDNDKGLFTTSSLL